MRKKDSSLYKFTAKVTPDGLINPPPEIVKELLNKNVKEIVVNFDFDVESIIDKSGIDKTKLNLVSELQELPLLVALEFFECKGNIKDKNFLFRIAEYEKLQKTSD